ncbi:hypothetical protein [Aeromonas sp. HMWF015]|uniref:hypothetical protein n=1 Tax=Aeromonas sp. HMWF015 TaxID=2056851 RepID=UPI000D3638C4|nr:hypothetical protein [Aeromonas sp. HMWF015]PTT56595.1 hypothetical protein DBR13_05250 [Aeromonas sp. HMWF015]
MTHLARIARDVGNPNLIRDLHNAIQTRVAFLFVRGSDGFVLKPVSEAGITGVVVWIGWGERGAADRHLPEVKRLARMIGARWLRFHSVRKGWLKVAKRQGWQRRPDDSDGFYVFQIDL